MAEDYSKRIRDGRTARGWSQEQLGAKINERVSTLSKIESGTMKPTDDLVSKLEKSLNIVLIEKVPLIKPEGKASRNSSFTLGDLIKKK